MKRRYLQRNSHGYTFMIALFVIVLIAVLGLGLMLTTSNTLNITKHERNDQSIFYIAEAGLNVEKKAVYTLVNNAYDFTRNKHKQTKKEDRDKIDFVRIFIEQINDSLPDQPVSNSSFEPQFNHHPEACVKVTMESESPLAIKIESTGFLNSSEKPIEIDKECTERISKHHRVVEQILEVDVNLKFLTDTDDGDGDKPVFELPNLAVQTSGDISLIGSATIYGSVATSNGSVFLNNGNGNITEKIGVDANKLYTPDWGPGPNKWTTIKNNVVHVKVSEIPLPPFPIDEFNSSSALPEPAPLNMRNKQIISNGNFTLVDGSKDGNKSNVYPLNFTQEIKFKSFKVSNDNLLALNIGSNNVNLFVDTFTLAQGHINIVGSGTLNIFVKNSLEITNGSKVNLTGNTNQLNFYYAGSNPINLTNSDVKINGSLNVQSANLSLGGSLGFQGNIISGGSEIVINGHSNSNSQFILAPNANVIVGNSGSIKGVIIGKSLSGSGNAKIYYNDDFVVPPPFPPSTSKPDYSDPEHLITEESMVEK
ncbi:hypothetical protein AAHH17_07195 [Lysinibacillus capsici]|uniref:DUF7305 domain-containing protein n=1 Tax=Lysinibacillus capsici TaxID=2115968 RepID=UPI0032E3BD1F